MQNSMAAIFSTNTNILSRIHSSNLVKCPFTLVNYKLLNRFNTSTAASPIFTTPELHDSASTSFTSSWEEFADKVSGEWDGFGADFTAEGKPMELPESVVPEAYREWEVKVFDWQTQCPTLAQSPHNSLIYKTIKLLPTVGCEADAATVYSIQERNIHDSSAAFAYQSSTGCYVAVWPPGNRINSMELEHCLIHPSNKESRVRIIQALELLQESNELKLVGIRVFVEQWYGPFRNGDQLGGCAIRDSAFAATQPLQASQVSSVWQTIAAVAHFQTSLNSNEQKTLIQQLGDECANTAMRDEDDLVLLPKQLWCSVKRAGDKGTCCEVGWLLGEGRAITSKCIFSCTTELMEVAIARESLKPYEEDTVQ